MTGQAADPRRPARPHARPHPHASSAATKAASRDGTWSTKPSMKTARCASRRGLKIIGEDYLVKAFQFAHEADPQAELYYNDYSLENEPKRKGAVELIRKLKAAGAAVTAIGLQGHDKLDWPTVEAAGRHHRSLPGAGHQGEHHRAGRGRAAAHHAPEHAPTSPRLPPRRPAPTRTLRACPTRCSAPWLRATRSCSASS